MIDAAVSTGPVPAWQTFAVGPYAKMTGTGRASWPVALPKPPWVDGATVGLTLDKFDGAEVSGTVQLWAPLGLDATTCAVEIIWDTNAKLGLRLGVPPVTLRPTGSRLTDNKWQFTAPVTTTLPVIQVSAFVFCPLNNAHIDRPWGVHFNAGQAIIGGPGAREAYCKVGKSTVNPTIDRKLEGHFTFELRFACGALIRLRGRDVIDECRGDVLLALDKLGAGVKPARVLAAGAPLDAEELRGVLEPERDCDSLALSSNVKLDRSVNAPFAAFIKRAGKRLVNAHSNDGRRRHHEPVGLDF